MLAVTHVHVCARSYQARPRKPSLLSISSLGSASQTEPIPSTTPTWWPLTYDIIPTQGASSLTALTSPSCHCTRSAHACPSSSRTLSSSAAPSGETLHPSRPSPRPALLSAQDGEQSLQGKVSFTVFLIRLKQALLGPPPHSSKHSPHFPPQEAPPSQVFRHCFGGEGEPCSLRALCASPQIQPGPREEMLRQYAVGGSGDRPAEAGGEGAARRPG